MTNRLSDKVCLVTGAASGIGRASAVGFLREGARVIFADADVERLAAVVAGEDPDRARAQPMDITDEAQVAEVFASLVRDGMTPDVVVANAGIQLIGRDAPIHELDAAVWRRTIDTNLTGTFFTLKHAVAAMLPHGGSVIVVGSPTGITGEGRGFTAYSASKAGIHGLSRVVAATYANQGIRVNTVIPGFTETPLTAGIIGDQRAHTAIVNRVPMGRAGLPEDIQGIMIYLASDESAYATGGMFMVDGGMTAL